MALCNSDMFIIKRLHHIWLVTCQIQSQHLLCHIFNINVNWVIDSQSKNIISLSQGFQQHQNLRSFVLKKGHARIITQVTIFFSKSCCNFLRTTYRCFRKNILIYENIMGQACLGMYLSFIGKLCKTLWNGIDENINFSSEINKKLQLN
jgi:hypothetical protein